MKIKHLCLLLCAIINSSLSAGLEEHFKKPQDKSGVHSMRNIDFIYTINLDERPEKFALCTNQLHPYGIYPYRFSAVNGWKLPMSVINSVGTKYDASMPKDLWGTSYHLGDGNP